MIGNKNRRRLKTFEMMHVFYIYIYIYKTNQFPDGWSPDVPKFIFDVDGNPNDVANGGQFVLGLEMVVNDPNPPVEAIR